jgi:hypothetical protein
VRTPEKVAVRWQRRYGGRRYIMGVPVGSEPMGTMVDTMVVWDIATRRVWHAYRPLVYRLARSMERALS